MVCQRRWSLVRSLVEPTNDAAASDVEDDPDHCQKYDHAKPSDVHEGNAKYLPRHEMGVIERAEPRLLHVVKA